MRKAVIISFLCLAIGASLGLYIALKAPFSMHKNTPNVSKITLHIEVQRLEQTLFGLGSKEKIKAFLKNNPLFTEQFLGLSPHGDDEALADKLYAMSHNAGMQDLYQEVQRVFGDFSSIQQQFEQAFRYLRYHYPDFQIPQVATFITGMGTDLYVSKDLIVIGLDFFLGEGAKYRPLELPQYIHRTYQPAYITPKTILLLSQQFIKVDNTDQTLLADMLYYGKAYYFTQAILPNVEESMLLGYASEQLADVKQHQDIVWEHFIEHELLYTTDHLTKEKYLGVRPFTAEIGPKCPGSIGRWLGWEIVKKYMQSHTNTSLLTLMHNANAQEIFSQAKYRP